MSKWMKMTVANGAPATLATYRDAIDVLRGYPMSPDPYDQHFADLVPNRVIGANARIAAAVAANQSPAQADVDLVTTPGMEEAWAINIDDSLPLASDPNVSLTPTEMQHMVPFPLAATFFNFDTTLVEWVEQTVGP